MFCNFFLLIILISYISLCSLIYYIEYNICYIGVSTPPPWWDPGFTLLSLEVFSKNIEQIIKEVIEVKVIQRKEIYQMYSEDLIWINQELFHHQDKTFSTNSILDVTISTSTSNNQSFSPPNLLVSLRKTTDSTRRNCTLNYKHICDLINTIDDITKNIDLAYQKEFSIDRRYTRDRNFKISFKMSKSNEKCVIIGIFYNDSDFGMIILNLDDFLSMMDLVKEFKRHYITLTLQISQRYLMTLVNQSNTDIKNAVKILPSQLSIVGEQEIVPDKGAAHTSSKTEAEHSIADFEKFTVVDETKENITSEFDTFSNENIDKVELHELNVVEKEADNKEIELNKDVKIDSPLINGLHNSVENFEHLINNIYHAENPIQSFMNSLKEIMPPSMVRYLPGIVEEDLKSACLISKVIFKSYFVNYLENGVPIPISSPIIKYEPVEGDDENIELAYDLLLITGYIKSLRNKIESKIDDSESNKAILNIASRCFIDIFIYSFLHDKNPDSIRSCVLSRFRNYHQSQFFESYENLCDVYNCNKVSERDINEFIDSVCDKIIGKSCNIKDLHIKLNESDTIKIGYENKYSIEQITNEIVELEVAIKYNKDISSITEDEDLIKLYSNKDVPKKKETKPKKTITYKTNISRFINEVDFIKQIPSSYKETFLKDISMLEGDFDFIATKYQMEEFGDDIIKALYIWNESDNKKERYTDFRVKHENCIDKELILSKIKIVDGLEDDTGSEGDFIGNLAELL